MIKIEDYIASYPDFPKEGILFRDIGPLLASYDAMTAAIDQFHEKLSPYKPDGFVGVESRGFCFQHCWHNVLGQGHIS